MKNFFVSLATAFFLSASLLAGTAAAQMQWVGQYAQELRPFDFSDKYYQTNGIYAYTLIGRKNGNDGASVFDLSDYRNYTNVRITETLPAYSADGSSIFWNLYGGATKASLTPDENGANAYTLAENYPVYVFPSTTVKSVDRQAAMIHPDDGYFGKNRIGIGSVIIVEYTDRLFTKQGWRVRQMLEQKNGVSLDGTPIIKTAKDLLGLVSEGFVNLRHPDDTERTFFVVAKVIEHPEHGGITPDAFLEYVRQLSGDPLSAESHFLKEFECLREGSSPCS